LNEGTINTASSLYKKLAPSEIKMREDSLKQRQNLIKNNPTLHLSLTRLSIRNIPRSVTSKDLKALAREAIVGFAKDAKEGRRQPISPEELSRDSEETKGDDKRRREKGKGLVKQAKIVFEGRDGSKIEEKTGGGRSRGYGFIEYFSHRHALMGLRWLNGHVVQVKSNDGEAEKKKRLIVEFAIENAQVVMRRKEFQEKARNKKEDGTERGGDDAKRGMKRKRPEGRGNTKGDKTKDKKADAVEEEEDDEKNKIAKRNRIIARKRQQRRSRKGKA
jgi:nucleolar protein 4